MATGDLTIFDEFTLDVGSEIHNLPSGNDVLKFGIIDNTAAPTAGQTTPTWSDFSANEITTATSYVANGVTMSGVDYTETGGTATLVANSFTIAQDGSGQSSVTAWGILYNDSAASDNCIAFVELGTIDLQAGDLVVKWNNVASGSPGTILTVATA